MKTIKINRVTLLAAAFGISAMIACERSNVELNSNKYRPSKLTVMSPAEAETIMPEVGLEIPSNLTDIFQRAGEEIAEITIPEGYTMIAETSEGFMQYNSKALIGMTCYCLNGETACGNVQVLPPRIQIHPTFPPRISVKGTLAYVTDTNRTVVIACIKTQNNCSGPDDPCNVIYSSGTVGEKILDITRATIIKNED